VKSVTLKEAKSLLDSWGCEYRLSRRTSASLV